VYYAIVNAAKCQQLAEADAMRLLAASAAALQAAPAAMDLLRHPLEADMCVDGPFCTAVLGELLACSTMALVSLLQWLSLPAVPPRVRQLAERRTLTTPALLAWLRSAAPVAPLLIDPSTGVGRGRSFTQLSALLMMLWLSQSAQHLCNRRLQSIHLQKPRNCPCHWPT
jgi:hypothetical protein